MLDDLLNIIYTLVQHLVAFKRLQLTHLRETIN